MGSKVSDGTKISHEYDCIKVAVRVKPGIEPDFIKDEPEKHKRMTFGGASLGNNVSKPSTAVSTQLQMQSEVESQQKHVVCVGETQVSINTATDTRNFVFDWVADPSSTQEDVWKKIGLDIAKSTIQGFNGTIIAYGQTGSGKTYTIFGGESSQNECNSQNKDARSGQSIRGTSPNQRIDISDKSSQGLVPRALHYIWEHIYSEEQRRIDASNGKATALNATPSSPDATELRLFDVTVSMCEIYNERVYDLLNENSGSGSGFVSPGSFAPGIQGSSPLQLRDDPTRGIYVEHLTEEIVRSLKESEKILYIGLKNRHVAATVMNRVSSRSHAIFTLRLEHTTERDGIRTCRSSKFTLVDLAGSERQKGSNNADMQLREAGQINRSLSELGNLIHSLTSSGATGTQPVHVQYRNSKLTYLLRDSLGGNSKTVMMAMITRSQNCMAETLTTLKFAQRAKKVKNSVRLNEQLVTGTVEALQREIAALKARIAASAIVEDISLHSHSTVHRSGGTDMATSTSPLATSKLAAPGSGPLSAANYIAQTSVITPIAFLRPGQRFYDAAESMRNVGQDIASAEDSELLSPEPRAPPSRSLTLSQASHFQQQLQTALERCCMADELRVRAELKSRALQQQLEHAEKQLEERCKLSEQDSPTISAITSIIRMEIEADLIKQRQIVQEMERRNRWTQSQDSRHPLGKPQSVVGQWVWQERDEHIFNHSLLHMLQDSNLIKTDSRFPQKGSDPADAAQSQIQVEQIKNLELSLQNERSEFDKRIKDMSAKHSMIVQNLQERVCLLDAQRLQSEASASADLQPLLLLKDTQYQQLFQQKKDIEAEVYDLKVIVEDLRVNGEQLEAGLVAARRDHSESQQCAAGFKSLLLGAEKALELYKLENKVLQEQNIPLAEDKMRLEEALRSLEARVHELEQSNSRLNAENEWMRDEVDSLLMQSESVIGEKQRMNGVLVRAENELSTTRLERDELSVRLQQLQTALAEHESSESQVSTLLAQQEAKQQQVRALQSALSASEERLSALQLECSSLQEERRSSGDKELALRSMVTTLSEKYAQSCASVEDLLGHNSVLTEKLSAAQTELTQRVHKEALNEAATLTLQSTIRNLQMQHLNQVKQCDALRLAVESSELQARISSQELSDLAADLQWKAQELQSALSHVEFLQAELIRVKQQQNGEEARKAVIAEVAAKAVRDVSQHRISSLVSDAAPAISQNPFPSGARDRVNRASLVPNAMSMNLARLQKCTENKLDKIHRRKSADHQRERTSEKVAECNVSADDDSKATTVSLNTTKESEGTESKACLTPASIFTSASSLHSAPGSSSHLDDLLTPHSSYSSDCDRSDFCNDKLNNLIPLIRIAEQNRESVLAAPAQHSVRIAPVITTPTGFSDPKLYETPMTEITDLYTDDDNDFEGIESESSAVAGDMWELNQGTPDATFPVPIVDASVHEGRIYCRIHHNISLGVTNIGNGNQQHLLSKSLSASPFFARGEWRDSYWSITTDKSHSCTELCLYRSKSDHKFNPKSRSGIIKSIVLKCDSRDSSDKENAYALNMQTLSSKNIVHTKHIKSKYVKGRNVYSFLLCSVKGPSSHGADVGMRDAPLVEQPLVKFASTDRGMVENLWLQIRSACKNGN